MNQRALRRHHVKRIARRRRPLAWQSTSDNELAVRHPLDCGSRCEKLLGAGSRRMKGKRELAREMTAG